MEPRVWLLAGHKAGDNQQVLALAEALGWPYEVKRLAYRPWELLTNRLLGATLAGIRRAASSPLAPPWPDLVITAGRRNEPVARWIRRRAGAPMRLVHLGRPWSPLDCFDLVVATPQYLLPERDNVLRVDLPLHRVTHVALERDLEAWVERYRALPRPYWGVLLGGNSGRYTFTEGKARRLAGWLNERIAETGGAVLVTDSARTPAATYGAFLSTLAGPSSAYRWGRSEGPNPYLAYLALAERLVVTGESMSMLAEAAATGRPLYIYDLADCPRAGLGSGQACRPWWAYRHNFSYRALSDRLAMRLAPRRFRRDISRIQDALIASGRAVWVGEEGPGWTSPGAPPELEGVARRVRSLFPDVP